MTRQRWRRLCTAPRWQAFVLATFAMGAGAEEPPATPRIPAVTSEGQPIATALPPELLRLVDAARRLNEEPGLILDRKAIYATLGVRPQGTRTFVTNDGARHMAQALVFEDQPDIARLEGSLGYSGNPRSAVWTVRVEVSFRHRQTCYPSRLVEAHWGAPFAYRPLGVHALMDELARKQSGAPPTGPHDGEPYNAGFWAPHATSANVSFSIGRGGCLSTISMGNLFKTAEYSDEAFQRD